MVVLAVPTDTPATATAALAVGLTILSVDPETKRRETLKFLDQDTLVSRLRKMTGDMRVVRGAGGEDEGGAAGVRGDDQGGDAGALRGG